LVSKSSPKQYAKGNTTTWQCFQQGTWLEQDSNQSLLCYKKAYQQGVYGAYCNAGLLLLGGNGIPQNIEKGIQLCVKGAELGAINVQ
jgi:TPR repeat protein